MTSLLSTSSHLDFTPRQLEIFIAFDQRKQAFFEVDLLNFNQDKKAPLFPPFFLYHPPLAPGILLLLTLSFEIPKQAVENYKVETRDIISFHPAIPGHIIKFTFRAEKKSGSLPLYAPVDFDFACQEEYSVEGGFPQPIPSLGYSRM